MKAEEMTYQDMRVGTAEEAYWNEFRNVAAMRAMQSLIGIQLGYKPSPEQIAEYAVVYADALIKELRKHDDISQAVEYEEPVFDQEHLNINDITKQMLERALERHNGNRKNAAQELGISDRTLYRRLKQYGIEP